MMKINFSLKNLFIYALVSSIVLFNLTSISQVLTTNYVKKAISGDVQKQIECLAKNIYYEAGSEPYEGKLAVAQVTVNRAESGKFPADICAVVYQKSYINNVMVCQFSWTCNQVGAVRNKYAWEESMLIAKRALTEDSLHDTIARTNALYFHATYIKPGWNRNQVVATIGNHVFYKKQ